MNETDLAKIKKDFEEIKANRPKSAEPIANKKDEPSSANTIKEAPVEVKKEEAKKEDNTGLFIGLGIGGGVIILGLIGAVGYLVWKQRKDAKKSVVEKK